MFPLKELKRSLLVSVWFAFLTFPIMVIKVDPIERTVDWRWDNMAFVAIGSFILSLLVKVWFLRQERRSGRKKDKQSPY